MTRKVNDVEYLSREAAVALLGIKKESLYTYASRGFVKAVQQPGSRRKLYLRSDLEKLKARGGMSAGEAVVSPSLRYGEPMVQTWISEIRPEGPRYRGHAVLDLAAQARSFEYVADLLWTGVAKKRDEPWPLPASASEAGTWLGAAQQGGADSSLVSILVTLALGHRNRDRPDGPGSQEEAGAVGRALICAFAGASGLLGTAATYCTMRPGEFVAECLLRGFGLASLGPFVDALNLALMLSAEHELSPPTFVARICASTGTDLPACVASAVLAQAGSMQAGGASEVEALFAAVMGTPGGVPAGYAAQDLPCFSHPLYHRDPRAALLVRVAREIASADGRLERVFRFVDEIGERYARHPNIFAGLTLLCLAMTLPDGTAMFLHTLGRVAGWIAHAAEQRLSGVMLRPRARYVGSPAT